MAQIEPMTRYDPIYRWLGSKTEKQISLSFAQLEEVLGAPLPVSARAHFEWWANARGAKPHVQCRAWLDAGYKTVAVDLANESVTFLQGD
jgi:hypothetical protein